MVLQFRRGRPRLVAIFCWRPRRWLVGGLLLAAVVFSAMGAASLRIETVEAKPTLAGIVVAVDAGHGGYDPGAIGCSGSLEKDVNLALAQKVAALLEAQGATVVRTRTADVSLGASKRTDLDARADIVESAEADIFITMQCNALNDSSCTGAQTFYYAGSGEGERLARALQAALRAELQNTWREALPCDTIYLLRVLPMTAVIVEAGFLSNADEEALLLDDAYQDRVAAAVTAGIIDYFSGAPDLPATANPATAGPATAGPATASIRNNSN